MATKNRTGGKQKGPAEQPEEEFALDERLRDNLQQAPLQPQYADDKKASENGPASQESSRLPLAGHEVEIKDDDSTKSYNNNKVATGNVILFNNLEIKDE